MSANGAALRTARVQSVGERTAEGKNLSYEIVTVETNRPLVQQAILSTFGDKLSVQRAIRFQPTTEETLTNQPFYVVESEDHSISEVLQSDAPEMAGAVGAVVKVQV